MSTKSPYKLNTNKDNMRIARKSDVLDNLKKGILFESFYDLETTGLSKEFSQPTEFGGCITDVAGNILHVADIKARQSDYTLFEFYAWIVTRINEEKNQEGISQYQLAGQVIEFFHISNHLDEAPFKKDFLKLCKKGTHTDENGHKVGFYKYPLLEDDGTVDWDSVRIHENCHKFYLRDQETGEWNTKNIASLSVGYNNVNADDQWIWSLLHMAAADNIFHTHVKRMGKYRLDMLREVEAASMIAPYSETGVKAGKKVDPETLKELKSYTQGSVIQENTHLASELRGIMEGVTNPDGSTVNMDQLHGALKDSLALAGLRHFVRRQVPDVSKQMGHNTDWMNVVEKLAENEGGFGNNPVCTFVDKEYPNILGKMVTLIGTDQYRNQPKLALVYDLSHDPETYRHNGKPLTELEPEDFATLINKGVFKVIRTHHCPRIFDEEVGYRAGFNNGIEKKELHSRAVYLQDPDIRDKAMAGLRIAHPKLGGPQSLLMAQPEEERFAFSTLEKYDLESNQNVQILPIKNTLDMLAQDSRKKHMAIKKLLLRAIGPHEPILVRDYKNADQEKEAAELFLDNIKDVNKKLAKECSIQLPAPVKEVNDKQSARIYKMQLLHHVRNLFASEQVRDIGQNYWFEDRHGHRINDETLKQWSQVRIDDAKKSGDLNVVHEDVNTTIEIIDRILDGEGLSDMLGPEIQQHQNDVKTLMRHGIPCLNGQDRWYTFADADRDVEKLLNNKVPDGDIKAIDKRYPGLWQKIGDGHHDMLSCIGEYMRYLNMEKERFPSFTPQQQLRMKIDPVTGSPMEKVRHKIDLSNVTLVTVPDRYLEQPVIEPVSQKPVWMLGITSAFNKASMAKDLKAGKEIVLQGQKLGKTYHLPKAMVLEKKPGNTSVHAKFQTELQVRYNESGASLPKPQKTIALSGENIEPIHSLASRNFESQSIKLPKRHFEGLVAPEISGYSQKPTGAILYDDGLSVYEGPVCIRECEDGQHKDETGWEFQTEIVKKRRLSINQLKKFSNQTAKSYGYSSTKNMVDSISKQFAEFNLNPKSPRSKVWVVDFGDIDPFDPELGTKYFNPVERKISAYEYDEEQQDDLETNFDNETYRV